MRLRLKHLSSGQEFALAGPATIGRHRECEVRLISPEISATHCQLYRLADSWFVLDLASKNGTRLNRNPLSDAPTPLADGDMLSMGYHTFLVNLEE